MRPGIGASTLLLEAPPLPHPHALLSFRKLRERLTSAMGRGKAPPRRYPPASRVGESQLENRRIPIVVGATYWTVTGVNIFSANLARGLSGEGLEAYVLLTEEETELISVSERSMPLPEDVRFDSLGLDRFDGWGRHWGRLVRYLEERAPCIYIPNSDWRHSCVCPRLSDRVVIVGVVHSDDPLHYDHVRRIGHTWNAIVAVSHAVAEKTAALCPELADRIVTIPIGVPIPRDPPLERGSRERLRLIYHGVLKQHQKRVLDLPRIVQAAADRDVPVELTIVGAGPDEAALRSAAAPLVERGLIKFHGVASPAETSRLLAQHDVYVLASEFEGMPNALIEAMGQGCVPVATRMTSGVPELVRDKKNGFLVPVGDAAAFAERLRKLWRRPRLRRRLSQRAFETVSNGRFRVEDMVESYRAVFERALEESARGRFVRRRGELAHPAAEVAGVSVFPVPLTHHEPGVGALPSAEDAQEYWLEIHASERGLRTRTPLSRGPRGKEAEDLRGLKVFVACPVWTDNGVNLWAEDLVRGLRGAGLDARVLLTEESTELVRIGGPRLERPDDIPFDELRPAGPDSWGARWGAMLRVLERSAPCIYLPNYDWRHSCITPLLSDQVIVVGTVHGADPLYEDHAHRLAQSWNALVATSRLDASRLRSAIPALDDRISAIPHGIVVAPIAKADLPAAPTRVLVLAGVDGPTSVEQLVARLTAAGIATTVILHGDAASSAELAASGAEVVTRPTRRRWLELCRSSHIIVATALGSTQRMTLEAMAHGCVPILATTAPTGGDLPIVNGRNGFLGAGGRDQVVERVLQLLRDPDLLSAMSREAHSSAARNQYSGEQMIGAFLELFRNLRQEARNGIKPQRARRLEPPPSSVGGTGVLPITHPFETDLGRFPSALDADRFVAEWIPDGVDRSEEARADQGPARERPPDELPVTGMKVFIACPIWLAGGVNDWAEDLARGLRLAGLDARLLFTEETTELVQIPGPRLDRPADVPVETLELTGADGWGARWGALTRLLERSAPCFYLPNDDWRHACVTPALSRDVMVVGTLHAAGGPYREQAGRLGASWNAIVATNTIAADQILRELPDLSDRLAMIPHGLTIPGPDLPAEGDPAAPVLVVIGPGGFPDAGVLVAQVATSGTPVTVVLLDDPRGLLEEPAAVEGVSVSRPNRYQWTQLCRASSVMVATLDPAVERRIVEAMAHGCVPVIVDPAVDTDADGIVVDGRNGLRVRGGTTDVVAAVKRVRSEPGLHAALRQRARAIGAEGYYRTDQMIATFVHLFSRIRADVHRGITPDRSGRVEMPPQSVDGVDILPIARDFDTQFGRFPSETDAERFLAERSSSAHR